MRVIEGALTKKEVHAVLAKYSDAICKELPSDIRYAKIVLLQDLDRDLRNTQVTLTYADLVPHGLWEEQWEHDFISAEEIVTGFCCSLCGYYYTKKHNYCPNCGAAMTDGGKDNDG